MKHGVPACGLSISTARQQRVVRVYLLDHALSLVFNKVLHHHQVAGHGDGEVGLGSDDQAETLQVGRDLKFTFILGAAGENFTQVDRTAFGRDGPEDVGQVFRTEPVGRRQAFKAGLDGCAPEMRHDFRAAVRGGQQAGSLKANLGRIAAMEVVDGRNVAANYLNLVNRHTVLSAVLGHRRCGGLHGHLPGRRWILLLRQYKSRRSQSHQKQRVTQSSSNHFRILLLRLESPVCLRRHCNPHARSATDWNRCPCCWPSCPGSRGVIAGGS